MYFGLNSSRIYHSADSVLTTKNLNDAKKFEIYFLISHLRTRIKLEYETVEGETIVQNKCRSPLLDSSWDSFLSIRLFLPVYLEQQRLENSAELGHCQSLQTGELYHICLMKLLKPNKASIDSRFSSLFPSLQHLCIRIKKLLKY